MRPHRPRARSPLAFVFALVTVAPLDAAVRKVPQQHPTIQAAVDAATPGDVILIDKGEYAEHVVVDGKADLTLRGKGKKSRLVDAVGHFRSIEVLNSSDITLDALRFVDEQIGVSIEDSPRVRVVKCRFEGLQGIESAAAEELLVRKCRFTTASTAVFSIGAGYGTVVRECRFVDPGDGLQFGVIHFQQEIDDMTVADSEFVGCQAGVSLKSVTAVLDCTFTDCAAGVELYGSALDPTLAGNTFNSCGTAILAASGADGGVVDDNSIKGGDVGFDLEGVMGMTLVRNTIKKTSADAFRLRTGSADCLFVDNVAKKAGASGFHVEGIGNAFLSNTAKKSAGFDLDDDTSAGDNSFVDNDFKHIAP